MILVAIRPFFRLNEYFVPCNLCWWIMLLFVLQLWIYVFESIIFVVYSNSDIAVLSFTLYLSSNIKVIQRHAYRKVFVFIQYFRNTRLYKTWTDVFKNIQLGVLSLYCLQLFLNPTTSSVMVCSYFKPQRLLLSWFVVILNLNAFFCHGLQLF